jgi:hypothetical protein
VYKYFSIEAVLKARSCHWDPVANRIKSSKETMLAQLSQWDPEFGMLEIENLELVDKSNPAGEAAEQTFLANVDSMYILQTDTDRMTVSDTQLHPPTTPLIVCHPVQHLQQHDMRSAQLPDDASAISFQEILALNSVRSDMESDKSVLVALRHQMKNLETGQAPILAALNGLQKPLGSIQSSTGTDPSSLAEEEESGGPSRATGHG